MSAVDEYGVNWTGSEWEGDAPRTRVKFTIPPLVPKYAHHTPTELNAMNYGTALAELLAMQPADVIAEWFKATWLDDGPKEELRELTRKLYAQHQAARKVAA